MKWFTTYTRNFMRNVTIYRHNDSSTRFVEWKNQNEMDNSEITPNWAEILIYTKLPTELVEYLKNANKERVSNILADYIP